MDSASFDGSDLPPIVGNQMASVSERQPIRWIWAALAMGFAAALANTVLGELTSALREAFIYNQFFYLHQRETTIALAVIGTLIVPALAMVFALRHTRDGPQDAMRPRARRVVGLALLAMLVLTLGAQFAGVLITSGTPGASSPADVTALINRLTAIQAGPASCAQSIGLIFALCTLTRRQTLTRHSAGRARLLDWALAGALVGVVMSAIAQLNRITLLSVIAVRLAQVGAIACAANSGASCFPQQMLDVALYSLLPPLVGAAIGGVIGGGLATLALASQVEESALPDAMVTPQGRSRLATILQYIAAVVIGALYAAYTLALLSLNGQRPSSAADVIMRNEVGYGWVILVAGLALAVPAGWLTLATAPRRPASAPANDSQRLRISWLMGCAIALALAVPASVWLLPGLSFGVGVAQIILEAFVVGAAVGFIWSPPSRTARPRPAWAAGALAAAPVWIGSSLIGAALVGAVFYSLSHPPATGSLTCHGLGCGALLMVLLDSVVQIGVNYIIFGLPAALFAGGLSALIRSNSVRAAR